MTAKRKARGTVARLEALEGREAARREEVQARTWAQLEAARAQLTPGDAAAYRDALGILEGGDVGGVLARLRVACAHLGEGLPVEHPAKEDAEAWAELALSGPDGAPLTPPDPARVPAFVAYFEACGAWCDREAARVPLSPDVHRLARWGGALWRFDAALCAELGRQA
ncbi:hypothetical protein [Deinococcus sp. PEB2-63]